MRARLDVEMARRGLANSREAAQRLIMAGRVRVNSRPADKFDLKVGQDSTIAVVRGGPDYASRGAHKLIAALDHFSISVEGRFALDIGASTGGFMDVMLRRGASRVIAIDVGYGQLALRIRNDPRVIVRDRTNIRGVKPGDLEYAPDLITIDTSFISLRLVLPVAVALAAPRCDIIALVKPQFEVGKGEVGKGGVVRDESQRQAVLRRILEFAARLGLEAAGSIDSPITGPAGNREILAWLRRADGGSR
jgi:23S rRNA (cytidine1920-2'-O)/16S rRNA (cytidine1409-2'-O)-methyltransferase